MSYPLPEPVRRLDPATFKPTMALLAYGGVDSATAQSFMQDEQQLYEWDRIWHNGDAAVDRQRSEVASEFLLRSDRDVLLFVDHDVQWSTYGGDAEHVVRLAYEHAAVVGGMYSKKARGQGWAGRFNDCVPHEIGSNELVPLGEDCYVGGGFMAIPRTALERIVQSLQMPCYGGSELKLVNVPLVMGSCGPFYPFFLPTLKVHSTRTKEGQQVAEYLSEDWVFQHYCRLAGVPVYCTMRPVLFHHGMARYGILDGTSGWPL